VIKPEFLLTAFRVIVVLGLLTSLYGLYQLSFGFPAFEQYWIDNTDFYNSISVGKVERALATFSSAEEWGRYVEIGALIAFGFAAQAVNRMSRTGWAVCGGFKPDAAIHRTAHGHVWFDSRVLVLVLTGARSWRAAVSRGFLLLAPALLIGVWPRRRPTMTCWTTATTNALKALLSHTRSRNS
jgi:hypothetical protein